MHQLAQSLHPYDDRFLALPPSVCRFLWKSLGDTLLVPTNRAVRHCHHMIPTPLFSICGPEVSASVGHEAISKSVSSATTQDQESIVHDKAVGLSTTGMSK